MLLEFEAGAGTVGVPVKDGEFIFAFKLRSDIKEVILAVFDSIEPEIDVILAVFAAVTPVTEVILAVFEETVFDIEVVLA